MSTRPEALARLDAARVKVIAALLSAGAEGEASAYKMLPTPGEKGWVYPYLGRLSSQHSTFHGTMLECERVRNAARRAKGLSREMDADITRLIEAIGVADATFLDFRKVFADVVEEGFSARGFTKAPKVAKRAKSSPT